MSKKNIISSVKWIFYVSNRFNKVDRNGRVTVTSKLASIGICLGVMALIVVLSVMNGFQSEYKNAIMEISSFHVRVNNVNNLFEFISWLEDDDNVSFSTPFYDAQGLMIGKSGRQSASLIRAIPSTTYMYDQGFRNEIEMVSGTFDLEDEDSIVLGYDLARTLGVSVGSCVNILAVSGSSDVSLLSNDRQYIVKGIFFCGYSDINSTYSFVKLSDNQKILGNDIEYTIGIKLKKTDKDKILINRIQNKEPYAKVVSWQEYNRSFFGALKIEKNLLMLLVFLIFLIVAVNIYNGMRRMVYERKEDIAVFSALGAKSREIRTVFVLKGFMTGLKGSVPGSVLGIFLCINIDKIFTFISKIQYWLEYIALSIVNPESLYYLTENSMFSVYASIPADMNVSEIICVFLFGILSSFLASLLASNGVLKMTVSEVLRDE